MAAAKSKAIEKDVDCLISSITGFSESIEEDQENFEICRRFVLSNVYYHRYLDTNSHEVRRQLHGLATKFRVHALPQYAQRLETLWKKLVERQDWAEHAQWDIEWRLLSLLVNLSHNPTSAASKPRPEPGQERSLDSLAETGEEQEQEVDWRKELRLQEQEYSPYQSPEEWSDLDDDEDINISPPPVHVVRFSRPSLLLPGVEVGRTRGTGRPQPLAEEGDPLTWIEERISRPYQPAEPGPGPLRPRPDAAETYHALQVRLGLAGPTDLSVLSEWCVCREVIWQLLSPADSSLLQCRDGEFRPTGRFRVHGLTQAALSSQLSRLCRPISAVSRLRGFIRAPGPLSTHRAFAAALTSHLEGLDAALVTLETELQKQEVTLTLRGVQCRLSDWLSHLAELDRLLRAGVLSVPPDQPAWVRTARLVSVLYESVELCSDRRWSPALVRLFLDTLQPLLAIVNGWTLLETDPDPAQEFLIRRNEETAVTDPQYWHGGFTVHSQFADWWTDGVEPLPFLLPHLESVVQTAKCLRILCHLRLTDHLDDRSLQDEFNRSVSAALSGTGQRESEAARSRLKSEEAATDAESGRDCPPKVPEGFLEDPPDAAASDEQPEDASPEEASSGSPPESDGVPAEPSVGTENATAPQPRKTESYRASSPTEPKVSPEDAATDATTPEGTLAHLPAPEGAPTKLPAPKDAPADPMAPDGTTADTEGAPADPPAPESATADPEGAPADPEGALADPPAPEEAPSEADSGRGSVFAVSPPPEGPAAPPGGMLQELLKACGSPYLTEAFGEVLQATDGGPDQTEDSQNDGAAPEVRLTTCIPHVVCSALIGPLAARQAAVCRRVVAALRSDYRLGEHLRMLRRVFLMEAGDLMAQFTQQLCSALASDSDSDESVSLTLCLEDCLSSRYPEHAARLSVTLQPPADRGLTVLERLGTVTLGYSVPWPCSIVITEGCVGRYNAMFRFLAQIGYTLRQLQALRFEELSRVSGEGDVSLDLARPEPVPRASRVLRLQLLRAWLLHFVGSIHSYIMMRVLHSTWLELEEQLEKATDVDSMVQNHELYLAVLLRRCLLSGAAERTLHTAVQSALQLAGRLQRLWTAAGPLPESQLLKLERDYVRCHHYTAGLLRQYRQSMGHVDSLAAAMAHSAPGEISYEELV